MPCPNELDHIEGKKTIRNLNGTDSAELSQYTYKGSFTYFDRMRFQVQTEKKKTPFTVTEMNFVGTGVFTYQPNNYDWITSTENSKSSCEGDQEHFFHKDSWAGH